MDNNYFSISNNQWKTIPILQSLISITLIFESLKLGFWFDFFQFHHNPNSTKKKD